MEIEAKAGTDCAPVDVSRCYVRFRELRADGFVEFVFSIDDPAMGVELILPEAAYRDFCSANRVHFITHDEATRLDHDASKWRFGRPGIHE